MSKSERSGSFVSLSSSSSTATQHGGVVLSYCRLATRRISEVDKTWSAATSRNRLGRHLRAAMMDAPWHALIVK
eukprot:1207443-Prymnesium_polylepis.2